MDSKESVSKTDIKNKLFNVKSLFLSCYGNQEGKYVFDIFYLNKNGEFVDIECEKKLVLNNMPLNKENYKNSLVIDENCKYTDYLKEHLQKGESKHNLDTISCFYKIKVDKNIYYLEEIEPGYAKDADFCMAPLFIQDIHPINNKILSTKLGYSFYAIEPIDKQDEYINSFINSITIIENKINYEDIIKTKKFINNISKKYYDSVYHDIEENEF